jgi:deoxyadenosine/deoxycytidine kinase
MSQIISIEGNIGSGKSTILKCLKFLLIENGHEIIFLQEPVSEWEKIKDKNGITILSKFYENQEKYSFAFQMMAYISRLSILKDTIKQYPNAIIITERCLNTDRYVFAKMLFDNGKLEDVEYQIYLNWFDHFSDMQNIQKVIYLKTTPDTCFYRVNKRHRDGESNISIEYLRSCHEYHEDMIKNIGENILILDSNMDFENDKSIEQEWIKKIKTFIFNNDN